MEDGVRLYTVGQLAEYFRVSKPAVYSLIRRGELVAVHIGRYIRVTPEELERFLSSAKSAA